MYNTIDLTTFMMDLAVGMDFPDAQGRILKGGKR